jgi:hypothetical protein
MQIKKAKSPYDLGLFSCVEKEGIFKNDQIAMALMRTGSQAMMIAQNLQLVKTRNHPI